MYRFVLAATFLTLLYTLGCGPDLSAQQSPLVPLLDGLGTHRHPITTASPQAQRYFDQGLVLAYGFNHEEAFRSFEQAARLDPGCAMCYWGMAWVLGPNINAPMDTSVVDEAWAALQQAQQANASPAEQGYIRALAARYAADPIADRATLDRAFAEAMRELVRQYPDDLDATTIFAEALMDLTPWNYWTPDGQPTQHTGEIVTTLERVLAQNPEHPGANHYYIHAVEASKTPERALPSAERLEHLVPAAGHLVHMPAHIYWRTGRYHQAVQSNRHAIHSDETYLPDRLTRGWYAMAYYPHNIHFLHVAAAMEGQSALALEAARTLVGKVSQETYQTFPPFEDFMPMPLFALLRFGQWEAVLQEPAPAERYQYATGVWHYARGMAFVRLNRLSEAEQAHAMLSAIADDPAMATFVLASFNPAATILDIARHTLAGELALARGNTDEGIGHFEAAVALQDPLPYIEPPAWYYPVRQSLGAALLQAGRAAEAEQVYRQDLAQYPENGWSLWGLYQSLHALGRADEAQAMRARFDAAWQWADVTLTASRF